MAIGDDISVDSSGNIRWTGGASTYYTGLQLHRWLQDLADDAQASGDDLIDITSDTPSERSTDKIFSLNSPYNIDDTVAMHLYDCSITQDGGNTQYSGLQIVGTVQSGTEIIVVQDDKVLVPFWGTGINAVPAQNIISQFLIKTREGGADIDGKRVLTMARELGDTYAEFSVTLGLGVSVSAISTVDDINNNSSDSTIEGWTTIANTEGYQLIDIDGDGTGEPYYSQYDKGSQSLNDTYEWNKQKTQRAHIVDNGTDTGTDYVVDNATITGQGQEFDPHATISEKLVEARFRLKVGAGSPTGTMVAELYDSDDATPGAPTGSALATSEPVLTSLLSSTYQEVVFRFNDNITLTAGNAYFIVVRHADGTATDYVHVDGAAAGAHTGNRAEDSGGWTGSAGSDLWFTVKGSPLFYGQAGETFRGITHEFDYDGEQNGPFTENAVLYWGTELATDNESGSFVVGEYVTFEPDGGGTIKNAGKVLYWTAGTLIVALENIAGSILADNDDITGLSSGATAKINATITDDDKAGGEGRMLAVDDQGLTGTIWIQRLAGSAPVDDLPIYERGSTAEALVNGAPTPRTVSTPSIGQSTGTNIIGAFGVGFDPNDVGAQDKFTDLTGTLRIPPNNVTFTVTGLVSGEDRVLVGPRTGSALEKGQWLLSTALSGGTETSVVVKTGAEAVPIAGDTPSNGQDPNNSRLRVQLNSGIYKRQDYVSWTGSTFTIPSTSYSGDPANVDNDVFLAYVDVLANGSSEGFTGVYQSDRNLFVRVRDGGSTPIKTFEANAVFGSSNASVAAIRQSDA
jgi:hypothetical protein